MWRDVGLVEITLFRSYVHFYITPGIRFSVWLVSGNAHVFQLLSVVIVNASSKASVE